VESSGWEAENLSSEDRIKVYDEEKIDERGDFLQWLRVEQAKDPSRMSYRDLVNHLSNNLGRGEQYNRDWPTGGYYLLAVLSKANRGDRTSGALN
jgi:hypothetical protein